MPLYRKKPVVIHAQQLGNGYDLDVSIMKWCDGIPINTDLDLFAPKEALFYLMTLEGMMFCKPGDWIIKGVKGEFYPCDPEVFKATYDREYDG